MAKNIPLTSLLLKALILDDYASAIDVISRKEFNPNEKSLTWGAPVLSALIVVLSGAPKKEDDKAVRDIIKEIISRDDFDPNIADGNGDTPLMHIAMHPDFNWVAPFILSKKNLNLGVKDFMHRTALEIAERERNTVLADMILAYKGKKAQGTSNVETVKVDKIECHLGMPKKRKGLATTAKVITIDTTTSTTGVVSILDKIECAFDDDVKKNPVSLYNLLRSFFKGDYSTAIQIAKDVNFNPNECDKWEEPALSSLIYYSQDSKVTYDEDRFKDVANAIMSNIRFNVNTIDADCNTVLMVAMGFPKLKWLTEKLFNLQYARLDIINDMGEGIRQIADKCGNGAFYNQLVMKSFETAKVI